MVSQYCKFIDIQKAILRIRSTYFSESLHRTEKEQR